MSVETTRRLAVATSSAMPDLHADDAHLLATLRTLGIEPVPVVWNDPAVDWTAFDAVLVRSIWDYFKHHDAYLRWLDGLPVPAINPARVLHWNRDKRYLLELAARGVQIIPTNLARGVDVAHVLEGMRGRHVVVKPTISGGAWHTVRGVVGEATFEQAVAALPRELEYMVQPFVPEIVSDGEWSLLFFGGAYSHAVLKRAAAGDYRVQADYGGVAESVEPSAALIDSARHVLETTEALGYRGIAYARVDGVVVDGRFLLMELEVIEPFLFFGGRPEAAERFAEVIRQRLEGAAA